MNVITVKTQNNFRICEIMKVTYRNKHHKPAPLSTCGARHCTLHRHSGPQQQYLAYHIKNRPIKVLALSIAPTKMSYRHTGQTQRIFKAFWGFRRLRTLPTGSRPLAGKHKEILLMGNGLEETVVSTRTSTFCTIWSMPLCAYESFWSSLKKKKKSGLTEHLSKWRATSVSAKLLRTSSETTCSTARHYHGEFGRLFLRLRQAWLEKSTIKFSCRNLKGHWHLRDASSRGFGSISEILTDKNSPYASERAQYAFIDPATCVPCNGNQRFHTRC